MNDVITPWTLINDEYFKTYSPIPDNFDLKDIRPYYKIAEEIWVKPILGIPLYEELLEQVNENNVTPENSTLLLMLYPYLSFCITYEALPFLSYRINEVGITKGKSDNSDSVSINDVNFINTHIRATVETLKSNFKKWIDEHSDSFPLYTPDNCSCSDYKCDDCQWILDYFGGNPNAYRNSVWFQKKNAPNTRLQAFSTPRRRIDLL